MRIEIGLDAATLKLATRVVELLGQLEGTMADILTQLETEVANNTTVDGSIVTLIGNIAATVAAAAPNNARVAAVLATLTANDQRMAALVTVNTPIASPAPVIPPPVVPSGTVATLGG